MQPFSALVVRHEDRFAVVGSGQQRFYSVRLSSQTRAAHEAHGPDNKVCQLMVDLFKDTNLVHFTQYLALTVARRQGQGGGKGESWFLEIQNCRDC